MILRRVSFVQGIFYLLTGAWPLVSMSTFEAVTGLKTDDWLVYTVGLLVAVSGAVLLSAAVRDRITAEIIGLAGGQAVALAAIDVYFFSQGVISWVYLLDAGAELLLILGWLAGICQVRARRASKVSVKRYRPDPFRAGGAAT